MTVSLMFTLHVPIDWPHPPSIIHLLIQAFIYSSTLLWARYCAYQAVKSGKIMGVATCEVLRRVEDKRSPPLCLLHLTHSPFRSACYPNE